MKSQELVFCSYCYLFSCVFFGSILLLHPLLNFLSPSSP